MRHQVIAPLLVMAVNLPLVIWAIVSRPRDPAHRVFAGFGLGLVIWNFGGLIGWYAGPNAAQSGLDPALWSRLRSIWLQWSFLGAMLVAPNMVHLALLSRAGGRAGTRLPLAGVLALYLPAIAAGILPDLDFVARGAVSNSWRRAFYDTSDSGALTVLALMAAYMAAALLIGRPRRADDPERRRRRSVMSRTVLVPWVVGVVTILIFGAIREERAPTAALWTMVVSQVAMFQLARLRLVELRFERVAWVKLFLISVLAGALVVLASVFVAWLFERRVNVESALVLTIVLVAVIYLYVAILPRLDSLAQRLASGKGGGKP